MHILGVIPARFSSTRFPGKPLAMIKGKPMIYHVYQRCLEAGCFCKVIVATDDVRIVEAVKSFGGNAILTSDKHESGTDRCFEVLNHVNDPIDAVINVQGDEPFIDPSAINKVAKLIKKGAAISSLGAKIKDTKILFDKNKVKVVLDKNQNALYFSRLPIPYQRDQQKNQWLDYHDYYVHLGIYGFSLQTIKEIEQLEPSTLEKLECLEQLRWLESGKKITIAIVKEAPLGVDTKDDLNAFLD